MADTPTPAKREGLPEALDTENQARVVELVLALSQAGTELEEKYFWHKTRDPYTSFLAEFFLRRSNRITVKRNLPGFVSQFPDPGSLAAAEPEDVVVAAHWAGLRKRTACLPQITAILMQREHWTATELRTLPHIGAYAAEGIALYVFDEATFPIDNNVRRVVGRSLGLGDESSLEDAVELITSDALKLGGQQLLRFVHMGALALGWDHCRTVPRCADCPLVDTCLSSGGKVRGLV